MKMKIGYPPTTEGIAEWDDFLIPGRIVEWRSKDPVSRDRICELVELVRWSEDRRGWLVKTGWSQELFLDYEEINQVEVPQARLI